MERRAPACESAGRMHAVSCREQRSRPRRIGSGLTSHHGNGLELTAVVMVVTLVYFPYLVAESAHCGSDT